MPRFTYFWNLWISVFPEFQESRHSGIKEYPEILEMLHSEIMYVFRQAMFVCMYICMCLTKHS